MSRARFPNLSQTLLAVSIALVVGCSRGAPLDSRGGGELEPDPVSGARAWEDLEALTALGPRPAGSDAARDARRQIRAALEDARIPVEWLETRSDSPPGPRTLTHVIATLAGASDDRIVLVAPYDSGRYDAFEFVGANDGASGAALLLEVARAMAQRDFPYELHFVWLEGEGRVGLGAAPDTRWLGSASLAQQWAEAGRLDGIRLLVSLNRVCDAELRIERDLGSHRMHREEFWRTAQRLGRAHHFDRSAGYVNITSSHSAFRRHGVRPVVAIEDTIFGGEEPPGSYAGSAEDRLEHCSAESLESVATVVVESLVSIAARLEKIDRFTRMPTAGAGEGALLDSLTGAAPGDGAADGAENRAAEAAPAS